MGPRPALGSDHGVPGRLMSLSCVSHEPLMAGREGSNEARFRRRHHADTRARARRAVELAGATSPVPAVHDRASAAQRNGSRGMQPRVGPPGTGSAGGRPDGVMRAVRYLTLSGRRPCAPVGDELPLTALTVRDAH